MSRILVTGASGFIGRALVAAFSMSGHTVRAAVRRPPQPAFGSTVEVVGLADLAQPLDWRPLLAGTDAVVHLAGVGQTSGVAGDLYDRINHLATARLAAAAAQAGVDRFVFVSSVRAQSGPAAAHTLTERDPAEPGDDYGRSKLAAEAAVRASGVPFTILRPVLVYGPAVTGNFALLMRIAASPLPLPLRNFDNRRSLLALDNFVSAIDFVLTASAAIGETYLVADPGPAPRLSEVITTLREARGRRPLLLPMPPVLFKTALRMLRRADVWERLGGDLVVDSGKLAADGWRPAHDTRSGLAAFARAGATPASGQASL